MIDPKDEKEKQAAMVLGKNLRMLREQYDYSQKQLAEALECSKGTIGRVERGLQTMKYWRLLRVCDLFHVSLDYLLRDFDYANLTSIPAYVVKLFQEADESEFKVLSSHMLTASQSISLIRSLKSRIPDPDDTQMYE